MTGAAISVAPLATGERASRVGFAAAITLLISAGSYLALFALMWGPVYAGNEGWLFLNPIFLLAWIPIELGAVAALALGVVSVVHARRPDAQRRRGRLAIIGGALLACLSLPVLWFGNIPLMLLAGPP